MQDEDKAASREYHKKMTEKKNEEAAKKPVKLTSAQIRAQRDLEQKAAQERCKSHSRKWQKRHASLRA